MPAGAPSALWRYAHPESGEKRSASTMISSIRTRLNPFSEEERSRLVNWGYLLADVALRSYVVPGAAPPTNPPFPAFGFSNPPAQGPTTVAGDG